MAIAGVEGNITYTTICLQREREEEEELNKQVQRYLQHPKQKMFFFGAVLDYRVSCARNRTLVMTLFWDSKSLTPGVLFCTKGSAILCHWVTVFFTGLSYGGWGV